MLANVGKYLVLIIIYSKASTQKWTGALLCDCMMSSSDGMDWNHLPGIRGSMGYHISCGCKLSQLGANKVSTKQISRRHVAITWFNWDSYTAVDTKLESEIGKWEKRKV